MDNLNIKQQNLTTLFTFEAERFAFFCSRILCKFQVEINQWSWSKAEKLKEE